MAASATIIYALLGQITRPMSDNGRKPGAIPGGLQAQPMMVGGEQTKARGEMASCFFLTDA
jgi:hypothetical protein